MTRARIATIVLLGLAVVACDSRPDAASAKVTAADTERAEPSPVARVPAVSGEEFMAGLALGFPHEVTSRRQVRQKGGGSADVFSIDFTEGSVRTIDRQLADALRAAGFERGARTKVPGGVRVAYIADDGRRVSTMIRNKKYFGDRIPAGSAGQISLSYVVPR